VIRFAVCLLLLASTAGAEPTTVLDGTAPWRVELPPGFTADDALADLDEGGQLAGWRDGAGRRIVVGRLRGNTDDGLAGERSYFAGLEEGVAKDTPGYRKLRSARRKLPRSLVAYDLWFRSGDAVRGARFVILRGYALVLSVHAPRTRRIDPALRGALESFVPEP